LLFKPIHNIIFRLNLQEYHQIKADDTAVYELILEVYCESFVNQIDFSSNRY